MDSPAANRLSTSEPTEVGDPTPAPAAGVVLRPMRAGEECEVRRIFTETIVLGRPSGFGHGELTAYRNLCLDWYLEHGEVTVADVDGKVRGYLLACLAQRRYERSARRRALRWLLQSLVALLLGRLRGDARRFTWLRIRDGWASWRHAPSAVYPAHAHLNLDPQVRDSSVGHRMAAAMDTRVEQAGLPGWFGELNVPEGRTLSAIERAGATVVYRQFSHTFSWLVGARVERATVARPLATRTGSVLEPAPARPGRRAG